VEFRSCRDFEEFERAVKFERRYIHSKTVLDFLDALRATLPKRHRSLFKGAILCRSQVGYEEFDIEGEYMISGFNEERMKPSMDLCGEGRANPRGIPYLYLSNNENTSMAELRPHIGQMLSVAQFRIERDLRIADCYSVEKELGDIELIFNPPTNQEDIGHAIWGAINKAFSRPIARSDSSSDYIPTQVLSEWFRDQGFDGICFKSSLGDGHNFVLFDLGSANVINCSVYDVKSIQFQFSECANRYYKKIAPSN
jgi:hypothetical protein